MVLADAPGGRPSYRLVRETPEGLLVVTAVPIEIAPVLESQTAEASKRGAKPLPQSRALRMRAYWTPWRTGEPELIHRSDVGLGSPGLFPGTFGLFDAKYTNGVLILVYCDQQSMHALVEDPRVFRASLLRFNEPREEKPDGTYFNWSNVLEGQEIEQLHPKAITIEGEIAEDNVRLNVQCHDARSIEFKLLRDGRGFRWFRPRG